MPPSVGYFQSVKISAYLTNVPKERGGDKGEQRGKRGMWVGRRGEERRGLVGRWGKVEGEETGEECYLQRGR